VDRNEKNGGKGGEKRVAWGERGGVRLMESRHHPFVWEWGGEMWASETCADLRHPSLLQKRVCGEGRKRGDNAKSRIVKERLVSEHPKRHTRSRRPVKKD